MTRYNITPVPKPRMTQRDKWLNPPRPGVAKYRAFKDAVCAAGVEIRVFGSDICFVLPMPASWSKIKRARMLGTRHQSRPDLSNLLKALEDALFTEDSHIWNYHGLTKIWGIKGEIIIE